MIDRNVVFLAYCIDKGKAALSDAEKARLAALATSWIRPGDYVKSVAQADAPPGAPALSPGTFAGTVKGVEEGGRIRVTLDAPLEVTTNGVTTVTSELVVPAEAVTRTTKSAASAA